MPAARTASMASITEPGPTGMPASRSARAKWTMLASSRPCMAAQRQPGCAAIPLRAHRVSWRRRHDAPSTPPRERSALTSSSSAAASLACIRAMSSWYFSSTPSVSLIASRRRAPARRAAISACAQSIVSATPGSLEQVISRSFWTKRDHLARQPLAGARHLGAARSRARARRRDSRPSDRGSAASARRGSRACGSR